MSREEAEKLADDFADLYFKRGCIEWSLMHKGYLRGIRAGYEKGVRDSAEVVKVRKLHNGETESFMIFSDNQGTYAADTGSILQLLNK